MIESSFEACAAVRGNPSRMNDAEGEGDGSAGRVSLIEEVEGIQRLAFSELRINRRIMSSGTSFPAFIATSASTPKLPVSKIRWTNSKSSGGRGSRGDWLYTERGLVPDVVPQEIARADGRELRVALHEALGLGAFAYTGGADEDDAGGALELEGCHL